MSDALEAHLQRQIEHSRKFFWQRLRWRVVRQHLPRRSRFELVDVGAGAGLLGEFVARDRPLASYRFVEPIESLREFLREHHGEESDFGDRADFGAAGYVALLDVLEHQEDDKTFLAQLVGKMQMGSTLLMTVPALSSLWSQWDVALGHFRRYDKKSLGECLGGLGLSVGEMSFIFPEMVPLAMLRARRSPASSASTELDEAAEFPDLPRLVNDAMYGVGSASLALRKKWPTGTSLFVAARLTQ